MSFHALRLGFLTASAENRHRASKFHINNNYVSLGLPYLPVGQHLRKRDRYRSYLADTPFWSKRFILCFRFSQLTVVKTEYSINLAMLTHLRSISVETPKVALSHNLTTTYRKYIPKFQCLYRGFNQRQLHCPSVALLWYY